MRARLEMFDGRVLWEKEGEPNAVGDAIFDEGLSSMIEDPDRLVVEAANGEKFVTGPGYDSPRMAVAKLDAFVNAHQEVQEEENENVLN